jgi:hypothetical protein
VSAEEQVNAIIADARSNANEALDKTIAYADAAQTAAGSVLTGLPGIHTPSEPEVTIPPFNPNVDLAGEFEQAFENALAEFGPDFTAEASRFLNQYFPDFAGCLQSSVDDWICNTITNGGTGIPAAVESQIWARSREKEILETVRAKDALSAQWASRGFSMPSGVMSQQLMMLDQDAVSKNSTHNRDVAIKQIEVEIENIRFAVSEGIKLRLSIVSAMVDYMRAFMQPWELAIQKAAALVDAKSRLWQSSATYYNALIAAAELQLKYDQLMIDRGLGANKLTVDQVIGTVSNRVNAAVAAMDAMANTAAAALNSQISLAKVGNETTNQQQSS